MSSTLIRGNGFSITTGGKPLGCGRSITLQEEVEMISATTKGTGSWAAYISGGKSWIADGESLLIINSDAVNTYKEIRELKNSGQEVILSVLITDVSGNTYPMYGRAIFKNISANGTVNNISSFSFSLQGVGELAQYPAPYNTVVTWVYGIYRYMTINCDVMVAATSYEIELLSDEITEGEYPPLIFTTLPQTVEVYLTEALNVNIRVRAIYTGGIYSEWTNYIKCEN